MSLQKICLSPRMLIDKSTDSHILLFCFMFYTFGGSLTFSFWTYSPLGMRECLLVWCLQARKIEGPAFAMTELNDIRSRMKGEKKHTAVSLWFHFKKKKSSPEIVTRSSKIHFFLYFPSSDHLYYSHCFLVVTVHYYQVSPNKYRFLNVSSSL